MRDTDHNLVLSTNDRFHPAHGINRPLQARSESDKIAFVQTITGRQQKAIQNVGDDIFGCQREGQGRQTPQGQEGMHGHAHLQFQNAEYYAAGQGRNGHVDEAVGNFHAAIAFGMMRDDVSYPALFGHAQSLSNPQRIGELGKGVGKVALTQWLESHPEQKEFPHVHEVHKEGDFGNLLNVIGNYEQLGMAKLVISLGYCWGWRWLVLLLGTIIVVVASVGDQSLCLCVIMGPNHEQSYVEVLPEQIVHGSDRGDGGPSHKEHQKHVFRMRLGTKRRPNSFQILLGQVKALEKGVGVACQRGVHQRFLMMLVFGIVLGRVDRWTLVVGTTWFCGILTKMR
mmetsp:Transcript_1391/g.3823  ORF Transcript_1391/g.3823 Transcript_1391/m.3823 type:complete len:340 (-) Transcript_1391:178-1197(-)